MLTGESKNYAFPNERGFTVVEVIVAASIMVILSVGLLSVFSYVVKLNQGNNLRSQALTVLQAEAEIYRSVKFVPSVTDPILNEDLAPVAKVSPPSADGTVFSIETTVTNFPLGTADADCKFKEITITVAAIDPKPAWLANLRTKLTLQRVRTN